MKYAILLWTMLFWAMAGVGWELGATDFRQSVDAAGWQVKLFGDLTGQWEDAAGEPLVLAAPNPKSWVFAVRDFFPAQLNGAKRVRLSAGICSNAPSRVMLVISEGASWGEAIDHNNRACGKQALIWEVVEVELERKDPNGMISFAVGLDYYQDGTWLAVDWIKLEAIEENGAFTTLTWPEKPPQFAVNDRLRQWLSAGIAPNQIRIGIGDELAAFAPDAAVETPATQIAMEVARNASAVATLLMANSSEYVLEYRCRLSGEAARYLRMYTLASIAGQPDYPMAWQPDEVRMLGRRQCVGMELVAETAADTPPGEYTGSFELIPVDGRLPVQSLPIRLQVHPVRLPERLPIRVFTWDYGMAARPESRDFLRRARVNVFSIPLYLREQAESAANVAGTLQSLLEVFEPGEFEVVFELWHVNAQGGWSAADNVWLDRLIALTAEYGLDYRDWYLHIYDEQLSEPFLRSARAIRAHNPRVRIFSDCLVKDPEVVRSFAPEVDLWCPLAGFLPPVTSAFDAGFEVMRQSGLPIWSYSCDSTPEQSPLSYRLQPYQAWLLGLDGTSFWSARSCALRTAPGEPNLGITYQSDSGELLPSRRWRQLRIGLEDYLLLELAAQVDPEQTRALANEILASREPGQAIGNIKHRLLELAGAATEGE